MTDTPPSNSLVENIRSSLRSSIRSIGNRESFLGLFSNNNDNKRNSACLNFDEQVANCSVRPRNSQQIRTMDFVGMTDLDFSRFESMQDTSIPEETGDPGEVTWCRRRRVSTASSPTQQAPDKKDDNKNQKEGGVVTSFLNKRMNTFMSNMDALGVRSQRRIDTFTKNMDTLGVRSQRHMNTFTKNMDTIAGRLGDSLTGSLTGSWTARDAAKLQSELNNDDKTANNEGTKVNPQEHSNHGQN